MTAGADRAARIRGGGEAQNATRGAEPNGILAEQNDARSFRSASARLFRGSSSATQSGASSVGPSKKRWRQKAPPYRSLKARRGAKRSPAIAYRALRPDNRLCRV